MREREIEEGNKREEREGCGDLKKNMGEKRNRRGRKENR